MPFTSERMRMSVLVRLQDDSIVLYSKGADVSILSRLHKGEIPRLSLKLKTTSIIFLTKGYGLLRTHTSEFRKRTISFLTLNTPKRPTCFTIARKRFFPFLFGVCVLCS